MKWKNKRHELDEYAKIILSEQNVQRKYYVFGAGLLGNYLLMIFRKYRCMAAFIDNSTDKQGSKVEGIEVISLESYLKVRDGQIVIAASAENRAAIARQLEANFLKHGTDFWLYDEFINIIFPIISTYSFNKSYVALAQITLTERCSLRCKKCAHGCYAVDNHISNDLTLAQVYKSADSFFSKVDFIKEFVLIGGEPLLYKELSQAIKYIGERYRDRMGIYCITTNGTIVPNSEVLDICKKYNVLFRISNYARQISRLKSSYQKLMDTLGKYEIPYVLGKEEREWMDYGFEYVNRVGTEDEMIKIFDDCRTPCREVRENKFYYCVMARSVSDNLNFNVGEEDYLDLDALEGEDYKKELLEFTLGYSEKGYLDMCRHCNGAEAKNYPIPAAEQMER